MLQRLIESPLGRLRIVGDDDGVSGIFFPLHAPDPGLSGVVVDNHPVLDRLAAELSAFFSGSLRVFSVPLRPRGTAFQLSVWTALCAIPFGETRAYGEIAEAVGKTKSVRAVAAANACNPLSIVIPCHRVVGADGSLTGYAGGLDAKRFLIDHERRVAGTAAQPDLF